MKKNKLILFDWGNIVESHAGNVSAWEELFTMSGYKGTTDELIKKIGSYRVTAIPNEEKFKETYEVMKNDFKLNTSYDEFINNYNKVFTNINYYKEVAEYEVSLKDKCYIGILSNLTIYDKDRLDKQVNLSLYDYVFLSFELACKKPDRIIYEKVQDELPFDKKDILFIDDRENNIESAREFGWNVLQATHDELDKIKEVCEVFINN